LNAGNNLLGERPVESAAQKARMAEDAWNTRDPARVALAVSGTASLITA
jgi:nuclear transport factor 2 (NTF2) superfamily protein